MHKIIHTLTFSTGGSVLLVRDFTPFAISAALMASLFFSMVDIVNLAILY